MYSLWLKQMWMPYARQASLCHFQRMSSRKASGKVLAPFCGYPIHNVFHLLSCDCIFMLVCKLERLLFSNVLDQIGKCVVLTNIVLQSVALSFSPISCSKVEISSPYTFELGLCTPRMWPIFLLGRSAVNVHNYKVVWTSFLVHSTYVSVHANKEKVKFHPLMPNCNDEQH